MLTGPQGQKRSRDPLKAALQVVQIATGERQEQPKTARKRRVLAVVVQKPAPCPNRQREREA